MDELLELIIPLKSDYMTTVRLATGGACSLAGLNLDDSEDCKVCVTESLLLIMRAGYSRARISFQKGDGLFVRIAGEASEGGAESSPEDEISCALLGALVENLTMERGDNCVSGVCFRFAV